MHTKTRVMRGQTRAQRPRLASTTQHQTTQPYPQLDTPQLNPNTPGNQSYGGHSDRETPGPIPNPEVKPASADGTAPERWWESRTPPNILSRKGHQQWWPFRHFFARSGARSPSTVDPPAPPF